MGRAHLGVRLPASGQCRQPAAGAQPVAQVDEHERAGRTLQTEPLALDAEGHDRAAPEHHHHDLPQVDRARRGQARR